MLVAHVTNDGAGQQGAARQEAAEQWWTVVLTPAVDMYRFEHSHTEKTGRNLS